jgi:putative inorganic carbon (hco3(-)) transporter
MNEWLNSRDIQFIVREIALACTVLLVLTATWAIEADAISWSALGAILAFSITTPRSLLLAVPMAIGISFKPFTAGSMQLNLLEILIFGAAVGLVVRAFPAGLRNRNRLEESIRKVLRSALQDGTTTALVLGLLVVGTVSLFTVADPDYSRESLRTFRWTIAMPLAYFVCLGIVRPTVIDRASLTIAFAAGGVLAAAIALFDAITGGGVAADAVTRLSGIAPHPNALALYLERVSVFALLMGILFRQRLNGWWFGAGAFTILITVLTFSRGALMGMAVAIVIMLLLGQVRRYAVLAAGGATAVAVVILFAAPERTLSLLGGGSGSLRLELWRSSLAMIRDFPIFGVGLDQFLYQYLPRYVSPPAWPERFTSHPHNLVLEAWLSLGIIGVALVMMVGVLWVVRVREGLKTGDRITLAAGGALAAAFIHGMLDRAYFLPELAVSAWLLIFLMNGAACRHALEQSPASHDAKG